MRNAVVVAWIACWMAVAPLRADEVLLSDDFATLKRDWTVSGAGRVANNKLVLDAAADGRCSCLYATQRWTDVDIRVTVTQTKGSLTDYDAARIEFWNDNDGNYYQAGITGDGWFSVDQVTKRSFTTVVTPWETNIIRSGVGKANSLRIVIQGGDVSMYVNDRRLAVFSGLPPKGGGFVGLATQADEDQASTWEFSDFSIRQASPQAPGDPIFSEDFATLEPSWSGGAGTARVENNALVLEPSPQSLTNVVRSGPPLANADVRVKLVQTKGSDDAIAGITFWASTDQDYYLASIQPSGKFSVFRHSPRGWSAPCLWKKDDAIRVGLGQTNELRVVLQGTTATFYVNGKEMTRLRGSPTFGWLTVGLHAQSQDQPATYTFSELKVLKASTEGQLPDPRVYDKQIFVDDFSRLDPAWGSADEIAHVENNGLILEPPPSGMRWRCFEGDVFKDVDIRVTVTELEGVADAMAGIVFWKTASNNYHVVLVRADGHYIVQRVTPEGTTEMTRWMKSSRINGVGKPNELRITIRKNLVTFYLGVEMTSFHGAVPGSGSNVGLIAQSPLDKPCKWRFSDFELWKVESEAEF